ncbi:hypothetical protein ACH5RR_019173 [Cinchona calisaya]|uniref:DUF4378 domain-containing protein n=1 Tax=Cinchona calisaya TaxID=153742 RepID=A0ABD2ZNK6_9GENT
MEGKQNTPSVIASLMGLDALPPQQLPHRQLKVLSEDYLRKTASIGLLEKSSLRVSRISRKAAEKQHSVKHIFDCEIPKNDKRSPWLIPGLKPNQGTVRAQIIFGRQKNPYPRRYHSIDKKFYHTEELNDLTRDNSVRYFNKSNLSTKQLHDPKALELHSDSGHLTAQIFTSVPTSADCKRSSRLEADNLSTRIVVLKPNSRKTQDSLMDLHLHSYDILHQKGDMEYRVYGEHLNCQSRELNAKLTETEESRGKEPPRYSSIDPLRVEQKAAKEEQKSISSSHKYALRSRITIEDSSVHGPKASRTSTQGSFCWKNRDRISNPFPSGPFFAWEAKKQIFERWKTTKSFEEFEVSGRRFTLGQMFAMQDAKARPKNSYSNLGKNCFSSSFCSKKENNEIGSSLVISSKVGSTNEYIRKLPGPKLLKNSYIATETPNFKTRSEASQNGCCSGQNEVITGKLHKLSSESLRGKDSLESMDSTVICEKQHQYCGSDLEGCHIPDCKLSSSNILSSVSDDSVCLRVNQGVQEDMQQKSSFDSPGEQLILRCTAKDSELAINLRETSQPSPDSVLEPPFKEENLPVSEFFGSPVSDLSCLAMKLHLLNPESEETNSEGSGMAVSSDEDTEKGSVDLSQYNEKLWGMLRPEESRDFSYLVDVLDEANLCDMNLNTWDGAESPVSPSVFQALEKKYGKQTSWANSERRLLFDHINSGLREILDSCMNFCMSAKPLRRRFTTTLRRDDIEEELWMLLRQEKEVGKDLAEKALGKEMKWMELEPDISFICSEIVEFLIDDLATELCSSESL